MPFCRTAPMMLALIGFSLSYCFLRSNRLPFGPATTKSAPCVKSRFSSSCFETDFLNCAPARIPNFSRCPCQSRSLLLAASLVPSTIRFFLCPFLSSLLLAISQARASEPRHGRMHGNVDMHQWELWTVTRSNGCDGIQSFQPGSSRIQVCLRL